MQCPALLALSSLGSTALAVVMRVAMAVMVMMTAMVPFAAAFAAALSAVTVFCCNAPEAVAAPSAFLALFRAVLGATAAAALCKLPCELFPLATLPVSALSNTTARVVFPAKVAHDHSCPV